MSDEGEYLESDEQSETQGTKVITGGGVFTSFTLLPFTKGTVGLSLRPAVVRNEND